MQYVLGVDIGSTTTKIVAVNLDGQPIKRIVVPLGTGTAAAQIALEKLYAEPEFGRADCCYLIATGYGRYSLNVADGQVGELSCHAKGIHTILPAVRTIIDIGGQDCKAIQLNENGVMQQFAMNDKCAAGTGRFLDTMSRVLNIPISEFGTMDLHSEKTVSISSTCAVFAESEVISCLSQNERVEDIIAGIHGSVARKVAGLTYRVGLMPQVCLTGGGALDDGIRRRLEQELNVAIVVPSDPQITGALGAAMLALEHYQKCLKAK